MRKRIVLILVVAMILSLLTAGCGLLESLLGNGDNGEIVYTDDFSDDSSGWEVGEYLDGWVAYADGTYEVGSTYTGSPMWGIAGQKFSDISVTVEATQYDAPSNSNNDFGIILREQGNADGYHFLISGDGYCAIYLLEDNYFTPLVDFETSDAIKQGDSTNTITAIANGDELTLIVNGETVASTTDDTFSSGDIGLAVTTYEEEQTVVRFDNLEATAPSGASSSSASASSNKGAQNTPESSPTSTTAAINTNNNDGTLYEDDFSDKDSGWEIGDYEEGWVNYTNGTYEVGAYSSGYPMWGIANRNFSDIAVTVEATQYDAPSNSNNSFGIILREQGNADGYHFLISGDGYYAIYLLEDGSLMPLVDFTASDVINQGNATNTITAVADGNDLAFIVNGETLATTTDDTFSSGDIALTTATYEDEQNVVRFDNLEAVDPSEISFTNIGSNSGGSSVVSGNTSNNNDGTLYEDDFSDKDSGWEIGEYDMGWVGYTNGTYEVGTTYTNSPMWGVANQKFSNLSVTVEATQYDAPSNNNNDFGVILREQGNADGYHFLISGDGYCAIYLLEDGDFTPLVDFAASDAVNQGYATNTITAVADGNDLTLIVNGETVASTTDSTFSSGDIALTTTSYEDEQNVVRFDNLQVTAP